MSNSTHIFMDVLCHIPRTQRNTHVKNVRWNEKILKTLLERATNEASSYIRLNGLHEVLSQQISHRSIDSWLRRCRRTYVLSCNAKQLLNLAFRAIEKLLFSRDKTQLQTACMTLKLRVRRGKMSINLQIITTKTLILWICEQLLRN